MKTILESTPKKKIVYTMNDEVYSLVSGIIEQTMRIKSPSTLTDIYYSLPDEIQVKIARSEVPHDFKIESFKFTQIVNEVAI